MIVRPILDPITNRRYDIMMNDQENKLWSILEAACGDKCPPDNVDYLCNGNAVPEEEAEVCRQCFLNWAASCGEPGSEFAKRLVQAIDLACLDKCPPDVKDYLCQADETESTTEETCTECLMRWAAKPFWKER